MKVCDHRERPRYAKGLCWPCYASCWRPRDKAGRLAKDGTWAAYRRQQKAGKRIGAAIKDTVAL